jgi:DNA polymerase
MDKLEVMKEIEEQVKICEKCRLREERNKYVIGEGSLDAKIMFVGEGPGRDEDREGRPFVGRAGQLLDKILDSVNISRNEIYITNVVKCRPPKNRDPRQDEIKACFPYLTSQISLINPKIIVTMGNFATKLLLNEQKKGITALRGNVFDWVGGIKIVPMFHPSYLLRNYTVEARKATWEDIKLVKKLYSDLAKK